MSNTPASLRVITLNTGLGMVVTVHVDAEGPNGASGVVVVSGEKAAFTGSSRWLTSHTTVGHVCEILRGSFTSTQRYGLGELIKNALTLHQINF